MNETMIKFRYVWKDMEGQIWYSYHILDEMETEDFWQFVRDTKKWNVLVARNLCQEEIEKRLCELRDELRKLVCYAYEHSRSKLDYLLVINDLNARMGELEWVLKDEMWEIEEDKK